MILYLLSRTKTQKRRPLQILLQTTSQAHNANKKPQKETIHTPTMMFRLTNNNNKAFNLAFAVVAAIAVIGNNFVVVHAQCADPAAASVATTNCWATRDPECIEAGYNGTVKKIHNGVVVREADPRTVETANFFLSFATFHPFQYLHVSNVPNVDNLASIRYIETVTLTDGTNFGLSEPQTEYPYNYTYTQLEHALVTVTDDCKIALWDQVGDDKEQEHDTRDWWAIMCKVLDPDTIVAIGYDPETCPQDDGSQGMASTNGDGDDGDGDEDATSTNGDEESGSSTAATTATNIVVVMLFSLVVGYIW